MHKDRFIPVLQIQKRRLIKTVGFVPDRYLGDPLNAIRIFNLKGVSELIITDISATESKIIDFSFLEKICAQAFVPIAYGGGISSIEDVHRLYQIGFDKVILNTAFFEQPQLIKEIVAIYGSQNVIGSFDYRKKHGNVVPTYYGAKKKSADESAESVINHFIKAGVGEIFLHDVERDGSYEGLDLEMISNLSEVCPVPIVACGGVKSLKDMEEGVKAGAAAVAAGSLFSFYGKHKAVLINYGGLC